MNPRRVAITGIGIICPLGRGKESNRSAIETGRSGIRRIESIDASPLQCRIAGEIPAGLIDSNKELDRFTRLALIASEEAARDSALEEAENPTRVGTLIGTGLGGSETLDATYARIYRDGQSRVSPTSIPRAMYNAAASAISSAHHALGPSFTVVSACASSAHAIGQAAHWIRAGLCDTVIAGGADAPLATGIIRGWEALRVLSPENDSPESACRPFSADRRGLVLAEGAAVLILEDLDGARRKGKHIYGEVAGFGLSSDGGHITDPSIDGAARAMTMALEDAGLNPEDIGYINAHGTATRTNDPSETAAIRQVFLAHADKLPVSSTKSGHGHAMGASGAIEIALSLLALNHGFLPPTLNYREKDPQCDLDYVPNQAREADIEVFLSNSFGFGGMNGVVAIRTGRSF